MDAVLSIRDVAFQYGPVPVLKGASLEVRPGSFVGLLGPNGSGKTTLLRIAAGLLKPSRGSIAVCGRPAAGMSRSDLARQLALLPQNPTLPLTFTARELAMMGRTPFLGLLGRESQQDLLAVDQAMEMARCSDLADRRLEELSGGERQRVLLARALAQQPRVLLMDEPTAHMDMRHQIGVADLVVDLVRGGLSAVGVFHDLNLAACYCDRIAVLHRGVIVVEGPPAEVMREGLLSHVFGVDLCLVDHPRSAVPAVLPPGSVKPRRHEDAKGVGTRS
jgi:iron complex transport system ATP-binding protein